MFYVDGHVRAYQGARKVAKTHLSRLKFPAPATVETWVSDASGDPVLVVMADPGASLAMELRRLLPDLRRAVGDHRRVLVGFDRGGWSPALFAHMDAQGFDVLTWRKGSAEDVDPDPVHRPHLHRRDRAHPPVAGRGHHRGPTRRRRRRSVHDAAGHPARRQQQDRQATTPGRTAPGRSTS